MNRINQKFSVPFGFSVIFTNDIFSPTNSALANVIEPSGNATPRAMVFVEEALTKHDPALVGKIDAWFAKHTDHVTLATPPQVLPGGEAAKNEFELVRKLAARMFAAHLSRHDYVVIVGGGALLDSVGFTASLVHRGLRQVRVPTTALSQNDGGVGVKNGINFAGQKNALGTFAPPWAVINDFDFLHTLTDRQWNDGIAEAFKVAIIRDESFFDFLGSRTADLRAREPGTMQTMIQRCAELHIEHIREGGDPFEFGAARPLDFGHWAAHKLELLSGFKISHGEAVAVGILLDSFYAAQKRWISPAEFEAIHTAFRNCGLPLWLDELELADDAGNLRIFEGITEFQEHLGGELCVTYPKGIGARHEVHEIDLAAMAAAVDELKGLAYGG